MRRERGREKTKTNQDFYLFACLLIIIERVTFISEGFSVVEKNCLIDYINADNSNSRHPTHLKLSRHILFIGC